MVERNGSRVRRPCPTAFRRRYVETRSSQLSTAQMTGSGAAASGVPVRPRKDILKALTGIDPAPASSLWIRATGPQQGPGDGDHKCLRAQVQTSTPAFLAFIFGEVLLMGTS